MALKQNAFYAQSGGVTSVINASACGVIESVNKSSKINKVLAGKNGILGALNEELIDTSKESKSTIAKLRQTPGELLDLVVSNCKTRSNKKKSMKGYSKYFLLTT